MKKTKKVYHYVEYSGNSIGCTDGGGLPIRTAAEQDSLDVEKLRHDSLKAIQNGKDFPQEVIQKIYNSLSEKPGSKKALEILHTSYSNRKFYT